MLFRLAGSAYDNRLCTLENVSFMSRSLQQLLLQARSAVEMAPDHIENWLMLAKFQQLQKLYAEAICSLEQGWARAAEQQRLALYLVIGERLLELYKLQGRGEEMALVARRLLANSELMALGMDRGTIHLKLAEYYRAASQSESALVHGGLALQLSAEQGDRYQEGEACFVLGRLYNRSQQIDQAEDYFTRALRIASELHQAVRMANLYSALANIAQQRERWDDAESMRRNAIRIGELLEHKAGLASDNANLGVTLMKQDKLKEAQGAFEKSLSLYKTLDNRKAEANQRMNLGIVLTHRNVLDEAEEQLQKGWGLYHLLDDAAGQQRATDLLVNLALLQKPFATLQ